MTKRVVSVHHMQPHRSLSQQKHSLRMAQVYLTSRALGLFDTSVSKGLSRPLVVEVVDGKMAVLLLLIK